MVSFQGFQMMEGSPIYLQLVAYVKRGMASGTIRDGEELPSRRTLSALLGVNPNTIQKAFRLLEEEGLVCSHTGAKSYVRLTEDRVQSLRRELVREDVGLIVSNLKQTGISRQEAVELLEAMWEELP